jgi:hypothetical protein
VWAEKKFIQNFGRKLWRYDTLRHTDVDVKTILRWIFVETVYSNVQYINLLEYMGRCLAVIDTIIDHFILVSAKTLSLVRFFNNF